MSRNLQDRLVGPHWHGHAQRWMVKFFRRGRRRHTRHFKELSEAQAVAAGSIEEFLAAFPARREHRRRAGEHVYFVRVDDGPIKIGRARNVEVRLRDLQQAHWKPITLLVSSSKLHEKEIHRRFSHLRIRGEWFNPSADLLEFIENVRGVQSGVQEIRVS